MIVAVIDGKDEVYIDRYIDIECNYRAFFFLILFFLIDFTEKKLFDYILRYIFNGIFSEKDFEIFENFLVHFV